MEIAAFYGTNPMFGLFGEEKAFFAKRIGGSSGLSLVFYGTKPIERIELRIGFDFASLDFFLKVSGSTWRVPGIPEVARGLES
jgi:hypothetical protein